MSASAAREEQRQPFRVPSVRSILALLALIILGATVVRAEGIPELESDDGPISVDADEVRYDSIAHVVAAQGNVIVRRGEMELMADEVRIDQDTHEVQARGNVRVTHPEGQIEAAAIDLDLDDETGFLTQAHLLSHHHRFSLRGEVIEKGNGQFYKLQRGQFTTCLCGDRAPDWSVSGDELDVTIGGYGYLKGGRFNILGVPTLYLPRAFLPVRQERQSGFLRPRFGASSRRGFQAVVPFYWAINRSHDVTVALDLETNARLGGLGEYRYAFNRDTQGLLDVSYFNELLRGDAGGLSVKSRIPEDRWSVGWEHSQALPAGVHAYVDGFVISDDGFLREINTFAFDYAHDVVFRTLPFTESRVGVMRSWDRALLKLEGVYYQDIDLTGIVTPSTETEPQTRRSRPESLTLQRAPELSLSAQSLIGSYLLGDFSASAVDYQRGRGELFDDTYGAFHDGLRVDLEPGLTVPLPLGRYAFGSVRGGIRETAYHLLQTENPDGSHAERVESRELFDVQAQIGTSVSRIYPFPWLGMAKLKHTIEPIAEYLYVPSVGQSDLPFFDRIDRIHHRNLATAGVVTRLLGKSAPTGDGTSISGDDIRELGRFWLMQSADFERRIAEIDQFDDRRTSDHFSDLDFGGHLNPSRSLSLRFQSHLDTADGAVSATTVGFFVQDPRPVDEEHRLVARTSAGVSYRFLRGNILEEIDGNAVIGVTRWLGLFYAARYNLIESRFLDNHFGVRLISTCDCWALDIGLTDRSNPNELEARVQFTLAGLGSPGEKVAKAP